MVELIEYILAFSISSAFAGSSLFLLTGYSPLVGRLDAQLEFIHVSNAAESALVENTNRSVATSLTTSIACAGNHLYLSSRETNYESTINGLCSFLYTVSGAHTITFIPDNGRLSLRVDG